ncbi:Uu.00g015320.m01.CDS01 [Anthostomella pinea]|uniref:Uu.00g015320.m01.CDS01 n=1 Tax=Anthostomella pinea TaxID=933095 RepID=A0AAI8YQD3_9PEZI|nr:Uu.00g015320.m01.CDS01 [Anthostomella pinea]
MRDTLRLSTLLKAVAAFSVSLWFLSYLGGPSSYHHILQQFKGEKAWFFTEFLENEIDREFDGTAIAQLCESKTWTKGLLFTCDPPAGGVDEVRNAYLNCIRLAIEAGAELIVPKVVQRNDRDITKVIPRPPRGTSLDYFYDRHHFNRSMSTLCPQMRLYWSIYELFDTPMGNPVKLSLSNMDIQRVNETVLERPGDWSLKFQEYLKMKKLNLPVKGSTGFAGVHLRTGEDVWSRFLAYDVQAAAYLNSLVQSSYSVAFLASGATPENMTAFAERAVDFNITVVTKADLLEEAELEYLHSLTWYQQALVDYELLLRAGLMVGTCESSFAWNIALRRAASIDSIGGDTVVDEQGPIRWQDRLSTIIGEQGKSGNLQLSIWL